MVNNKAWLDDIQRNISELIAKSPAADIERNVKAFMGQAFTRMDLVTREEFDVQAALLERALARLNELETKVQTLQSELGRQRSGDSSAS